MVVGQLKIELDVGLAPVTRHNPQAYALYLEAVQLLVAKVNMRENPQVRKKFKKLSLPALVTLDEGDVESKAGQILPDDVDAHVDFLLGRGPFPTQTAKQEQSKQSKELIRLNELNCSRLAPVIQTRDSSPQSPCQIFLLEKLSFHLIYFFRL